MNIKLIIFLIGLTILIVAVSLGVNIFLEKKPNNQKQQVSPSQQTNNQTPSQKFQNPKGLDIAQQTVLFLDKSLKDDGSFQWIYKCDSRVGENCLETSDIPSYSSPVFLSYIDLYKKTQDPKYKKQADKAVKSFLNKCQANADYCELVVIPLSIYFQETADNKYKEALVKISDKFMSEKSLYLQVQQNYGIKLEALYQATHDKKYQDKLRQAADELLLGRLDNHPKNRSIYKEGNFTFKELSLQMVWANLLPAYRVTGDKRYLEKAKEILDKSKILDHFDLFQRNNSLTYLLFAIDSLSFLGEVDNPIYLSEAAKIAQKLLSDLWDNPQHIKFDGDFGWLRNFEGKVNLKSIVYNDWIIKIFLKMDKQTFSYE